MSYTVTWKCFRCKRQYSSVEGAKFRMYAGHKRRICATCLSEIETRIKEKSHDNPVHA